MIDYLYWVYKWIQGEIFALPGRVIALAFFTLLLIIPLMGVNYSTLSFLIIASIFAIFAASWDLLAITGQISLGHALFFGTAGYAAALINIHFGLKAWATIPIGSFCAVFIGLFAGIPALRLRGFYLALVTLAFPIILTGIILVFSKFLGGEMGLIGIDRLFKSRVGEYYFVVIIMIFSSLAMWKLSDPGSKVIRTGVIFHAIRADEITARTSGINTVKYKLLAYAFSGFFAGIAGGLFVHFFRIAGPSILEIFFSLQVMMWTIFGGMGTVYGGITGVFILYPLTEYIRVFGWGEELRFIILALIMILTLLFMPQGISVWVLDKIEIKCQRCKVTNIATRRFCRACRAPLRLERKS
jgi:branched-chain amino acid transport system permease protein